MSQPKNREDSPQPAPTDRKPVPTRTDVNAETVDVYKGVGAGAQARHAATVTVAAPRVAETITSTGPRDRLPAQQSLVTATPREPGAPVSDASLPSGRLGQYELIRLIGRGGMGTVYLARDLRLGRALQPREHRRHPRRRRA